MNSAKALRCVISIFLLLNVERALLAQEMVTIPKSRLQELERKEAELARIKGEFSQAKAQNVELQKQHEADAAKIATAPNIAPLDARPSPPMATLPPLKPGDVVEAVDLANHYRADAAVADQRYRKRKFLVQGEVAGFDKPPFRRDYKLILRTADRDLRVVCDISPPERFQAVFTIRNGLELVGTLAGETRVPIARIGDKVMVEGQCRGMRDSAVAMTGCELKPGR